MTYPLFKHIHKEASDKLEEASHRMKQFNEFRLPNGLTPDQLKAFIEDNMLDEGIEQTEIEAWMDKQVF